MNESIRQTKNPMSKTIKTIINKKIKELQLHDETRVENSIHAFLEPKNKNLIIHKISIHKRHNTKKLNHLFCDYILDHILNPTLKFQTIFLKLRMINQETLLRNRHMIRNCGKQLDGLNQILYPFCE